MRRFKLMADYEAWPIWETSGGQYCNVDPAVLGLSDALVKRIEDWADTYSATHNQADPSQSGFDTPDAQSRFEHEGLAIWWALQAALPEAEISYFSESFQRLYGPK